MFQLAPCELKPVYEEPESFLDLKDPGDETIPADMHSFPPVSHKVNGLQDLIFLMSMEILENEIDATLLLASQWSTSRVHPDSKASRFPDTYTHVPPLDLEHGLKIDPHSQALAVSMPWHPRPALVRQARHPISIQVPEPLGSTSFFSMGNLADKIDATAIACPLPSQRRSSQGQPTTAATGLPPSIQAHVSFPEPGKAFGEGDGSRMLGVLALGGVCLCALFGVACIVLGISVSKYQGTLGDTVLPPGPWRNSTLPPMYQVYKGVVTILPGLSNLEPEMMSFGLDIMVTLCTESVGYVHSVALRSALAFESQLEYNTNLRLFPPLRAGSWMHPNGTLCNAIMAFLLILAYASSSMVFVQLSSTVSNNGSDTWYSTAVFAEPLIVLGMSLLIPVIISLLSIWRTTVLTWSFSPFDITKALLQAERIARTRGKCMTNVVDTISGQPRRALSERQPSAWESHPQVPIIVSLMWALALAFALAGVANLCVWMWDEAHGSGGAFVMSWALLPNGNTNETNYWQDVDPSRGYPYWARNFLLVTITQGFLTLGLHGCEVVVNVIRDEAQWRLATTATGMRLLRNPLLSQLSNWPNIGLLVAKPLLHWIFGLALDFKGHVSPLNVVMMTLELNVRTVQTWYLSFCILVIAIALTFLAHRRPCGYQPAAYGHIQTLANVVDKWMSTLYWGEKPGRGEAGELYNTGTDNHPLPQPMISDWFSMV